MSNAKLRAHIGLRVPQSSRPLRNGIRVGSEIREWAEGEALLFDDSFEHEVWWRSGLDSEGEELELDERLAQEERVVLIVDIFHPELPTEARVEIRAQMAAQHQHVDDVAVDSGQTSGSTPNNDGKPLAQTAADSDRVSLLAGGYRSGDLVRAIVAQSDRVELQAGEQGVVVGPGQAPDKLFVDFGGRRWHLTPDALMRELEYAADLERLKNANYTGESALENDIGTTAQVSEETSPMMVRVVRQDPLILAVENFLSEAEVALLRRLGLPLLKRSSTSLTPAKSIHLSLSLARARARSLSRSRFLSVLLSLCHSLTLSFHILFMEQAFSMQVQHKGRRLSYAHPAQHSSATHWRLTRR